MFLSQNTDIGLSCVTLGPVPGWSVRWSGAPLLLWLLVQLHIRHEDVLLCLLGEAGIGAAVAGSFIGPPGPDSPAAVQVDYADDQHHQHQARHHDDNESGQVVTIHWEEI